MATASGRTVTVAKDVDGPGAQATFARVKGVSVAQDGTVYVTEDTLVRKIEPDDAHTVSTFAGSAVAALRCNDAQKSAHGQPAKRVILSGLNDNDFGVAASPDGSVWIGAGYDLIRVDPAGIAWCFGQTPGQVDSNVAVSSDGTVYFARDDWQDLGNSNQDTIRQLLPDGTSKIIAGGKGKGVPEDRASATSTKIGVVRSMVPGPDGSLYFISLFSGSARIYQLTPPPKQSTPNCEFVFPSPDGSQQFCFNKDGRHLSTRNARTGAPLPSATTSIIF